MMILCCDHLIVIRILYLRCLLIIGYPPHLSKSSPINGKLNPLYNFLKSNLLLCLFFPCTGTHMLFSLLLRFSNFSESYSKVYTYSSFHIKSFKLTCYLFIQYLLHNGVFCKVPVRISRESQECCVWDFADVWNGMDTRRQEVRKIDNVPVQSISKTYFICFYCSIVSTIYVYPQHYSEAIIQY